MIPLSDKDIDISKNEKDQIVESMTREFPNSVYKRMTGLLQNAGYTIQQKAHQWAEFNPGRVFASLMQNILFWLKMKWLWSHTDGKKKLKKRTKKEKQVTSLYVKYFYSSRKW